MKNKNKILVCLFISSSILFTGCWDKVEFEEQGYVGAIGIDNGPKNSIRVTFQIVKTVSQSGPSATGSAMGSSEKATSEIITINSPDFFSARDLVGIAITRKITLSHSRVLIVGEDFAKSYKFYPILEASLRDEEMRRSMGLMITRETAEEFINNNKMILESSPTKFYQLMTQRWKQIGYVPPRSNINRFIQRTEQGESIFIANYGTTKIFSVKGGKNESDYLPGEIGMTSKTSTEIIGSAVLKDGKMVGRLNGDETRLVSMLRSTPEFQSILYSQVDPLDPKYMIGMRLKKDKKTKIYIDTNKDVPLIDVTVPITIEVLSIPSFVNYPEDTEKQTILKNAIENEFETSSLNLVEKTQKEFKGDPFLWENEARKNFLTYNAYKNYSWSAKYPEANVKIHYKVTIRGFGKALKPPNKESETQ
ncbi:Ger(x)C family spore germination protein [Clostridium omnivorum]|uniref:Ger(X)C family spore germination protein n=1 Tax=Clostridium omnivorum TaxID=1604902 RepID=A0ABQ5NC35_9CLOT|nr:Ger(x)C family spore germination protein [Clostridium sp. E14]GLC32590.1 hypothetical protein bsdE14_40000 [Clostridium sp. E14]